MKLSQLNDTVNPWQVVRVMDKSGAPRYFLRSDTGQWGELDVSLSISDVEIDTDTVAYMVDKVWITDYVENDYVEPEPTEPEVESVPFVLSPMPEDTKDRESLDSTNPPVYSHDTPEMPVEEE